MTLKWVVCEFCVCEKLYIWVKLLNIWFLACTVLRWHGSLSADVETQVSQNKDAVNKGLGIDLRKQGGRQCWF